MRINPAPLIRLNVGVLAQDACFARYSKSQIAERSMYSSIVALSNEIRNETLLIGNIGRRREKLISWFSLSIFYRPMRRTTCVRHVVNVIMHDQTGSWAMSPSGYTRVRALRACRPGVSSDMIGELS